MKIKDQKIERFLEELASRSPTPGGGAVAALTGAMAASLVEMVCNLTIGKRGYEKYTKNLEADAKIAKADRKILLQLADVDVSAFDSVMAAYKSKDKKEIRKALKYAIDIPEKVAAICMEIDDMAYELEKIGNKNVFSDAKTAHALAGAAINGAMANVHINGEALAKLY